ncbi:MAG: magnesium transporter CorA family protein [Clostridia bacterium]|nr:magnesium transporter CorA family protein [Clostridia bacterium]MDD4386157.1 magnesium transporter CorA family protein [Clostridia bacterium]
MIEVLKTNIATGKLEIVEGITKGVWINIVEPTSEEIQYISHKLNVEENLLRYPLDIAEKAHIDTDDDNVLITVDVPITEFKGERKVYSTIPLGMLLIRDDYFVTISQSRIDVVNEVLNSIKIFDIFTDKKSRLVFQILYKIASDYIRYIGYISKDIDSFEKNMHKAMKNDELLYLLDFEKTMIYFNASIKANQTVLRKINRGKIIKLYDEDEDILDDTIIENTQAIEMVQTYSEILNGIIDIFGTIVSNNLNTVMKFLTSVTIIIAVPTMISSFGGMNVEFPFFSTRIGFYIILIIAVICTILATLWFKKKDML